MKLSYPRYSILQKAMDKVNSVVQEYLIGVRLVKAFGTYDQECDKFEESNVNLMQKSVSAQMIITLISPLMTLSVGIGTVLVIFAGSSLFTVNLANPGDITAFTVYMAQILTSLIMITNIFNTFVRTKASTARIKEVFDCAGDFNGGGEAKELNGDIEFENVTFAYPGGSGVPALKNLSFSVKNGESLAVIGPTGSGKSTVAWLLLRFYDVNEGRILINGTDIRDLNVDTVRKNVAIVPQKAMLFTGSVAENIRWGNKEATDERIRQAAEKAEAGFINDMEEGFDSLLGRGGVNVSGGQKQRISIARGIVKNAPVLILDDATSALDAVTEAKVRRNLKESSDKQTVIIITQRCGTAMSADRILVLDNGEKVGFGTHEQLMKDCEVYRDIYKTQIESSREA
jgi:ATP-binding cassette subfamily B protein